MGVRGRVLTVTLVILMVTLALWSWLFLRLLDASLERTAVAHARSGVTLLAAQIARDPETALPASAEDPDEVWQVIDAAGAVKAASHSGATRPLTPLRPPAGHALTERVDELPGIDDDAFVIAVRGVVTPEGPMTVVVAQAMHVEELPLMLTILAVLSSGVVIVLLGAGLVRWAIGASLTPVERMRRQLAEMAGGEAAAVPTAGRVSVPTTGDELQRLGETMNELLDRLAASAQTQRRFVSDASHELRTPLAVLRSQVDLGGRPEDWAATRPVVDVEVGRLQRLVDDLLILSRADAGALTLRLRECDLDDLVISEVRRLQPTRVPVERVLTPVRVHADPDRLSQILANLITNAVRHAESRVRVSVHAHGVDVDNDGPVIAPEQRETVFERFVRLDQTRGRASGGTGLGLAIAAELALAQGGRLTCGEAPDGWCRFSLWLPDPPR